MANAIDLVGIRFGRLFVLARAARDGALIRRHARWHCRCDCGAECSVASVELRSGATISCGCYRVEKITGRNMKHGMYRTPEYTAWRSMHQRCGNPAAKNFPRYGGRGISVCREWGLFEQFLSDMGLRPSPKHSLDRRDNDKGYCPDNCQWATIGEQHENRSNTSRASWGGKEQPLLHIAEQTGKKRASIYYHVKVADRLIEDAVAKAVSQTKRVIK